MFKVLGIYDKNFYLFKNFFVSGFISEKNRLIFGAISDIDMPCGIISVKYENKGIWCIDNFYVLKKYRNLGIGSALLKRLKEMLLEIGYKKIYLKLVASRSGANLLEKFLVKRGFGKAKILTKIYRKSPKEIYGNKFIRYILKDRNNEFPSNLKIVRYNEINEKVKNNILKEENVTYPWGLSPFINEHNLRDIFSLFVLDTEQNNLVAWLTVFDAPGDCVLYRSFFVKKEYRDTKVCKILLKKAIENHVKNLFDKSILFAISAENSKIEKSHTRYFNLRKEDASYEIIMRGLQC